MKSMQSLPHPLQNIIDHANATMQLHPQKLLPLQQRRAIYNACNQIDEYILKKLIVLSAQRVLPQWGIVWPDEVIPYLWLNKAIIAINQSVSLPPNDDNTWRYFEDLLATWQGWQQTNVICAGIAAWHAFYDTTVNLHTLLAPNQTISDEEVDRCTFEDLLTGTPCDTALWAAFAYLEPSSGDLLVSSKWAEYWEWWLAEAIPQAYHSVSINLNMPSTSLMRSRAFRGTEEQIEKTLVLAETVEAKFPNLLTDLEKFPGYTYASRLSIDFAKLPDYSIVFIPWPIRDEFRNFFSKVVLHFDKELLISDPWGMELFLPNQGIFISHNDILEKLQGIHITQPLNQIVSQLLPPLHTPVPDSWGYQLEQSLHKPLTEEMFILARAVLTAAHVPEPLVDTLLGEVKVGRKDNIVKDVIALIKSF